MEQAGKENAQMEGSMLNVLLDEWTEQKQFNPDVTTVLPAEFANVCIPHPQKHLCHYYGTIFN